MHTSATSVTPVKKAGLLYWAQRVVEECENASQEFAADPVHDLRVAIRRCRSMADGFLSLDPDRGWKQMKRIAKPLFASLGELRDVQVMREWVEKLSDADDPARQVLLVDLQGREAQLKLAAQQALGKFDRKHWLWLNTHLNARAERVPLGGTVFQLLALERWNDGRELHRRALRNRSGSAYHQLRIGIKRLRYTVENFLPELHGPWSKDLRDLQDALGEVHDFDVLWAMLRSHGEVAPEVRLHWHATIQKERDQRLEFYRASMVGRQSLWYRWRAALPAEDQLQSVGLEKFRVWASFLDPRFNETTYIASVTLKLYDSLAEQQVIAADQRHRCILEAAALTQEVGSSKHDKGQRKRSFKLLHKLAPPPGWSTEDVRAVAIVGRYHRGALVPMSHPMFAGLSAPARTQLLQLAGVLRLANALVAAAQSSDIRPRVSRTDGIVSIAAHGIENQIGLEGERLARAKYLLEVASQVAIEIRSPSAIGREPANGRLSPRRGASRQAGWRTSGA